MLAVLASGNGSNFEALAQSFPGQIDLLICNVPEAFVLNRARKHDIPQLVLNHRDFPNRSQHERAITAALLKIPMLKIVILAGYMRILTKIFFEDLQDFTTQGGHIINLHPAHLEDYKGPDGYGAAVLGRYPRWGLSVHEVTEVLDTGALLGSQEFAIYPYESEAEVRARAQVLEHALLVAVVKRLLSSENNL